MVVKLKFKDETKIEIEQKSYLIICILNYLVKNSYINDTKIIIDLMLE